MSYTKEIQMFYSKFLKLAQIIFFLRTDINYHLKYFLKLWGCIYNLIESIEASNIMGIING
jgi:hypothetical protein